MKLILTSDLHYRPDWYHFLAHQSCDALLIGGDLLDHDFKDGSMKQMLSLVKWCKEYPGVLALCSGNHDAIECCGEYDPTALSKLSDTEKETLMKIFSAEHWMDVMGSSSIITNRRSELLQTPAGGLVVTTLPFSFMATGDPHSISLLVKGRKLKASSGAPWIVLHHEHPAESKVGGFYGDRWILNRIREFCPDFLLSGHQHAQPYLGDFADKVDATWCFNPGYPDQREAVNLSIPNHILLDLSNKTATWIAGPMKRTMKLK